MKKALSLILSILMFTTGGYLIFKGLIQPNIKEQPKSLEDLELYNMNAGDVFEEGGYVSCDGITITYNGTNFIVENKSDDIYMITCGVYGQKKDGNFEQLATVSFVATDEVQYQKDLEENGWAVKQYTNKINPSETLTFELNVNGYISFAAETIGNFDVDSDGYYDIAFTYSKQKDENSITTSSDDSISEYYKLKVE